jgi:hypothetical protein
MEPEDSLPCSQEPSTGPCPEPDQSTHLRLGLPSGLLPSDFPTNILYAFLFAPFHTTFHAHLVFPDLIILFIHGKEYKLMKLLIMHFIKSLSDSVQVQGGAMRLR